MVKKRGKQKMTMVPGEDYNRIDFDKYLPKSKVKKTGFLDPCSHYLLCGSTGSGKTSLMMQLLLNKELRSDFKRLFVFNGFGSEDKWLFIREALVQKYGLEYDDIIIESDINKFPDRSNKDIFNDQKAPETFVIFDDWMNAGKTAAIQRKINNSILDYLTKSRKNNCSTFVLAQYFYSLPTVLRNQFSGGIMIWNFKTARAARMFAKEVCAEVDEETVYDMYKKCTSQKYGFFSYFPQKKHKFRCGLKHKFILEDSDSESDSESS